MQKVDSSIDVLLVSVQNPKSQVPEVFICPSYSALTKLSADFEPDCVISVRSVPFKCISVPGED